jgi:hypothetical protein
MALYEYSSIQHPHSQITFLQLNVTWPTPSLYVFKVDASSDIQSNNSVCNFHNTSDFKNLMPLN